MSEIFAPTVIQTGEAIVSFGSGNGPTGGTGRQVARGKGRSGTRKASPGAVRSLNAAARRHGGFGASKEAKALASKVANYKGNHTNKSVAAFGAALRSGRLDAFHKGLRQSNAREARRRAGK